LKTDSESLPMTDAGSELRRSAPKRWPRWVQRGTDRQ